MNEQAGRRTNLGFQDVDRLGDSGEATRFLDGVAQRMAQFKRDTYAMIEISPGQHVLDVGCGTGDDVRAIAGIVGLAGRVVGLDNSMRMVETARERAGENDLPIEFVYGNVLDLPFDDGAFDACRAERVLEHVEGPEDGLAEMIRVTRDGGRIFASDVDLGTLVMDHPEQDLLARVRDLWVDEAVNGLMGRELYRLFQVAGLSDIHVLPVTVAVTAETYDTTPSMQVLETLYQHALDSGVFTPDEYDRWMKGINTARQDGTYFSSITAYAVYGTKSSS